ncbi:predicted protein [Plenodomus lingam JN3]|uniref:Uncharacterized protein n=1 Tax=Leptosphaeria maculans (strain JN3 / isolate v23.1.3 / race Av1-4-5-6-7-8) TaxID=985895 RepID=E5A7K8_LEPMJ|nr:predicted protein [Plenodomus lingam JN3]CBX99603.1 predicted protein [Plenodomus lingam JN3]
MLVVSDVGMHRKIQGARKRLKAEAITKLKCLGEYIERLLLDMKIPHDQLFELAVPNYLHPA